MRTIPSKVPFDYKTIRTTQSRIDKGLLAIPVSLVDLFPDTKTTIYVALGPNAQLAPKGFTPYTSSSGECRIGGMRAFYERFQVKGGDELVIQILDDRKYKILTEQQFQESVKSLEQALDKSKDDGEAGERLKKLSEVTNSDFGDTVLREFFRLSRNDFNERRYNKLTLGRKKEPIPAGIRKVLAEIYGGKCQITKFGFLTRNGTPYFETHHIRPDFGHHLKNLLVVSPNIHALFTHARVEEYFDNEGWLRRVKFNDEEHLVTHVIDKVPKQFKKEIHSMGGRSNRT